MLWYNGVEWSAQSILWYYWRVIAYNGWGSGLSTI